MTRILLLSLLLLCIPAQGLANAGNDLSFADSLFEEGDDYRAITEYKRFIHLHPDSPRRPEATFRIAECYLNGKRWIEAEKALERVITDFPGSEESRKASLLHADIPYQTKDFKEARRRYTEIAEKSETEATRQQAEYRIGWTFLEEDDFTKARERFQKLGDQETIELATGVEGLEETPLKSPEIAGGLSALLPGAGQLYSGRTKEAILAFLLNAAFIGAAVEAFDNDNEVLGGILLFFEAGWYGGNVFNAVNSAHKENRDRLEKKKKVLRDRFGFSLTLSDRSVSLGISAPR